MSIFKRKVKDKFNTEVPKIVIGTKSRAADSYYRLKDNVIYYSDNGKNKVFQIESSIAGEGKSTVIVNLAVSLAKSNKKVLILDLDFRRPKVHRVFGVPNFNGLAEYMLGECGKEDLIKRTEYGVDIINRGKSAHNASIIFTSDKFKALIDECKEKYDYVLFDCPPVLMVSDYIHIAKLSDAIIFVVCSGITRRSQLSEAVELLHRADANIFGTVLTFRKNAKIGPRYSKYYYGRYYQKIQNRYLSED